MIPKFRAWDFVNKIMWEVEEIDFRNGIVKVKYNGKHVDNCIACKDHQDCYSPYLRLQDLELLQFSGWQDKYKYDIYNGDIINLINEDSKSINAVCEFGTARRKIFENTIDIIGFYFKLPNGKKTFPIVNNYCSKHDTEIFEIIGNRFENIDLLKERWK